MVKPLKFAETIQARSAQRGPLRRFVGQRLARWLTRHRHPFNLAIHIIGIPMAVTGLVLLFFSALVLGRGLFYCRLFVAVHRPPSRRQRCGRMGGH
jgi:hypothetical protein